MWHVQLRVLLVWSHHLCPTTCDGTFGALPLAPYERRKTLRVEYIPGEVWAFEQKIGLLYVHTPVRMTAVRMEAGGLLLYGAVAPTDECIELLRELEVEYGPVRYLVLPTVAVEHKTFAGPLAQRLPDAEVWVAPGQFAVPVNLPLEFWVPSWTKARASSK